MMNMPDFGLNPSQSGTGDFNMDSYVPYDFGTGQYLDQELHSSYAHGSQYNHSIRPSDLDANAFHDMAIFEGSQPTESHLQIDPTLTENTGTLGQHVLAQPLTPSTSHSPETFGARHVHHGSFTGRAASTKTNNHKRRGTEPDEGDADAERRFKNRVAASKCRVKKKSREQKLIQASDEKELRNSELRSEHRRLTQEALWLKDQLITHGNCGDRRINQWLTKSAAKIVHNFNEGSTLQLDAPSRPSLRPPARPPARTSAEIAYDERRDSGISTNSKSDFKAHGSPPPTGRRVSSKIGLESPADETVTQDQSISPVDFRSESDVDHMYRKSVRRTRSLDHSALDSSANAASKRAHSVPLQESDDARYLDPVSSDAFDQGQFVKGKRSAAPPGMVNSSMPAVPWDAQLSVAAMTIDPRLRGAVDPMNVDAGYFALSMQQVEQSHDDLLQIPGNKWMEA